MAQQAAGQQGIPQRWEGSAAGLLDPGKRGHIVVVGGSGTGKTALLVDIVAAHVAAGTNPDSILVLTSSTTASADLRARVSAAVLGGPGRAVIREPMVRTVHSYAFATLARHAAAQGNPPPRLITAAEQDSVIRDLLCGQAEDGTGGWPEPLLPALTTAGFAAAVRDLMARCSERGVDPVRLRKLGRQHDRPEWMAVAALARQYEEVMLLRSAVGMAAPQATVPALGAAELVGSALEVLGSAPEILAAEQNRIDLLLVDDAQHLDPQAARMVRVLAAHAGLAVVAGDSNQSVFGFRGADAQLLDPTRETVTMTVSHRCAAPVAAAANAVAARLPGVAAARVIEGATNESAWVRVQVAPTELAERTAIADTLRRAHLVDGVPWSQMAVIVRSVRRTGPALRRALQSAGVPVRADAHDGPLTSQPTVHALLLCVGAAEGQLEPEQAVSLLTGPIGRVDPVALRKLRRTVLRNNESSGELSGSSELLREALLDGADPVGLTDVQAAPVRRIRAVIDAVRQAVRRHASPLDVLWAAWARSGLQRRLTGLSQRGGALGVQADRDLDVVAALFEVATDHVMRTPAVSLGGLVDHLTALALASPRAGGVESEAIAIVSAHAATGRQWDVVVVAGVQDGLWPNMTPRGGVLNGQRLIDVLDGLDASAQLSGTAVALAEERRLFLLAVGRARTRLLITAVDNENGDSAGGPSMPSRFVTELIAEHPEWVASGGNSGYSDERPLTVAALVGELRAAVTAPIGSVSEERRHGAARELARLAEAGVVGAHPDSWSGLGDISSEGALWCSDDGPVRLSPSNVESLTACPLRWMLERHGGTDLADPRRTIGTLMHSLLSEPGASPRALAARLENDWEAVPFESQWFARNELHRHRQMLDTFAAWHAASRDQLTEVGREIAVDGVLTHPEGSGPQVRLVGRIDRLERDSAGRPVIVDLKTGKSPATKDEAQEHAQLAAYQVAAAQGAIEGEPEGEPGGGRLVYIAKPHLDDGATERHQDPLTPQTGRGWQDTIHAAAAATQGPQFVARINDGCGHCPVRSCCPAQPEGRAVGQS